MSPSLSCIILVHWSPQLGCGSGTPWRGGDGVVYHQLLAGEKMNRLLHFVRSTSCPREYYFVAFSQEKKHKLYFPRFLQRWRRRWFVLEKATEGQFVLNYYTDESKRKLKGTIYLDECEQVKPHAQLPIHREDLFIRLDV